MNITRDIFYDANRDMWGTGIGAQQAYNNAMMEQQQRAMMAQQAMSYEEFVRRERSAGLQASKKVEAADTTLAFMDNTNTKVLLTEGE